MTLVATDGTKRAQNGRRPSPSEAIRLSRVEGADGCPPTWPGQTSPLLTTSQAAEYLHVSVRTAKNLLSDGSIAYVKIGRATRVHRDDLEEFRFPQPTSGAVRHASQLTRGTSRTGRSSYRYIPRAPRHAAVRRAFRNCSTRAAALSAEPASRCAYSRFDVSRSA